MRELKTEELHQVAGGILPVLAVQALVRVAIWGAVAGAAYYASR